MTTGAHGGHTTSWDDIATSTVWYRTHTVNTTQPHGLAEVTAEKVTI